MNLYRVIVGSVSYLFAIWLLPRDDSKSTAVQAIGQGHGIRGWIFLIIQLKIVAVVRNAQLAQLSSLTERTLIDF